MTLDGQTLLCEKCLPAALSRNLSNLRCKKLRFRCVSSISFTVWSTLLAVLSFIVVAITIPALPAGDDGAGALVSPSDEDRGVVSDITLSLTDYVSSEKTSRSDQPLSLSASTSTKNLNSKYASIYQI